MINKLIALILKILPYRILRRILWVLSINPEIADRCNYHIRANHFYEPLPDFTQLTLDKVSRRRENQSINWNLDVQLNLLKSLEKYSGELKVLQQEKQKFDFRNLQFQALDASIYYSIIRHLKPKTVIEIGSGYSTQICYQAITKNSEEDNIGKILCIEPYPSKSLKDLKESSSNVDLIERPLEELNLNMFKMLEAGDILFIDSTHTVKFNSDVCREFLDILPTLPSGVWIHIHDIFFPLDYPPKWLIEERRAWNEQYLVEAFLSYNSSFEVRLANHWLSLDFPEKLSSLWPEVLGWDSSHRCASLWIYKK